MDPLRAEELAYQKTLTPGQRLRQALQMMEDGFAMQRANLRRRYSAASEEELENRFLEWLSR